MLHMKRCNDNALARMAETPLFSNLTETERRELMTELNVRIRSYAQEEIVAHACEPAAEVITVLKGRVSVYESGSREDGRHLVYRLSPGETYGATFPVLDLKANPALLVANGSAEVLLCKVTRIREMLKRGTHAAFVANLYAASARQGFYAWRKLSLVGCYEIADRVLLYLRWCEEDGLSETEMPSPAELAEYLGVNRTALYRALDKLKRQKRITVARGCVQPQARR